MESGPLVLLPSLTEKEAQGVDVVKSGVLSRALSLWTRPVTCLGLLSTANADVESEDFKEVLRQF